MQSDKQKVKEKAFSRVFIWTSDLGKDKRELYMKKTDKPQDNLESQNSHASLWKNSSYKLVKFKPAVLSILSGFTQAKF